MPKLVDSVIRAARWLAPRSRRALGRVLRLAVAVMILAGLVIVGCTEWLRFEARGHIFGVDDVPARAVALCRQLGLDADGVGDSSAAQFRKPWITGAVREYGAAGKAGYDVISGRDPVYLGRHETGVEDALRAG